MNKFMFDERKNYLIYGENKIELGKHLIKQTDNWSVINLEKYKPDCVSGNVFFYNYKFCHKKDIQKHLDSDSCVILAIDYPLAVDITNFDFIFVSKLKKEEIQLIHNVFFKFNFTLETFKNLNENNNHFLVVEKKHGFETNSGFGFYSITRGYKQEPFNTLYDYIVDLKNKFTLK